MDITALFKLSYGMYIITTKDDTRDVGCVANSIIQVSSSPATLAISLNKNNYTTSCIQQTGTFAVSILSENVPENVIGTFGFSSSKDKNKFENISHIPSESGLALLNEGICANIECRVINQTDCYSHVVFLAEIADARKLSEEPPMTYEYYHKVIKGKAPKNAPTYVAEPADNVSRYICDVCRYVYPGAHEEFIGLPESYVCPVCGAPKSRFTLK